MMVAPVQVMLGGFILLPALYVGWLSFYESSFGLAANYVGLENYIRLFSDLQFWRAFWNTFIIVNVVVYGELAIALGMAALFMAGVPLRRLMISIVLMPYAVSPVLAVVMWKFMLTPEIGIVNYTLTQLGIPPILWASNPTHGIIVIILLSIWLHTPFTFIITYSAMLAIPNELYEAGRVDGAGPFFLFWRITIPIIMPAIFIALMFRYVFAFRIFSEVWILTRGGPVNLTETLAIYLYRFGFRYHEWGLAAAASWMMVFFTALITAYYFRLMYKQMFAADA